MLHIRRNVFLVSLFASVLCGAVWIRSVSRLWILPVAFLATALTVTLLSWLLIAAVSLTVPMRNQYEQPSRFYSAVFNFGYAWILALANVRVHVSGLENVPNVPFLFVSNHRSKFDNMIAAVVLHKMPVAFISKPSNFKIPMGRHYMRRSCYLSIDRESVAQSYETFMHAAKLLGSGVTSMGVYPEGTRSKATEMGEFHEGCFMIAKHAGAPILVATAHGTQNIHKRGPWRRTDVWFDILALIPAQEVAASRPGVLSARVREIMENNMEKRKGENRP